MNLSANFLAGCQEDGLNFQNLAKCSFDFRMTAFRKTLGFYGLQSNGEMLGFYGLQSNGETLGFYGLQSNGLNSLETYLICRAR